MTSGSAILGIDIGTSSCKALLLDTDARVRATAVADYPVSQPQPGWSEQDPQDWVKGAGTAIKAALEAAGHPRIEGIGLSGQMHGLVALDNQSAVIRPAILWNDQRNAAECATFIETMGGLDALLAETRNTMLTGYTGGKIAWLKAHEPAAFARLAQVLNPKDYLRFRLTGEIATEGSDASGTGLFDVARGRWSERAANAVGIDLSVLPTCVASTDRTGTVSEDAAQTFGVAAGTPVFGGGGDAVIQTLGSGVFAPGDLQVTIGTAGVVAGLADAPLDNSQGHLQVFRNVLPGQWHTMGVSLNAGGAFAWFADLCRGLTGSSQSGPDFATLVELAAGSPAGARGAFFLPYLNGERCPHPDPSARGGFVGLTTGHGAADVARSVLEGVVFSLAEIAGLMADEGVRSDRVLASGGGTRSPLWCQIIADVFDAEVLTDESAAHGGALGAAIVAGLGHGLWTSPEAAYPPAEDLRRYQPDPSREATYRQAFATFRRLYPGVAHATDGEAR